MAAKTKTPDYTKRAIEKYNSKFDRCSVNLEKGIKEKVLEKSGCKSINQFVNMVIADYLKEN